MATLQDILSGSFPAARRYAEGYAQMPEYLQDPYLGLSTSNIGKVTKGLLGLQTPEEFVKLAEKGKLNTAKNTKQEIGGLLSGKSKFAELPNLDWDNPKTYDLVDPLIAKGFKEKTIKQGPDTVTLLYKSPEDIKLLENANNPYEYGKAYGYSDADIAHFYSKRFGDNGFNMLSEAMGKKPYTKKTEFELAQEVASKNAETLLGLPKGNTAMERAKAMGYTEPLYRGSSAVETKLIPSSGHEHGVMGISTTPNPAYASLHGNNVMPLLGKKVNTSDYFDLVHQFENQTGKDFGDISEKQFTNFLRKNNIEASTATDYLQPVENALDIRYLNPKDIRSQFAAFDPARANKPDLLAATMAIPVSGLLEQPKDKKKKK